MGKVILTLVCTAANTGKTGLLAKRWPITDGKLKVQCDEAEVGRKLRYFATHHAAFLEGSQELAHAQEVDSGNSALQAILEQRAAGSADCNSQSQQPGPSPEAADNGSGAGNAPTDGAEHGATGSGHQDAGVDEQKRFGELIRTAVSGLDPDNDEHWTVEGLPKVDVIAQRLGNPALSRKDLNVHADGMVRPGR